MPRFVDIESPYAAPSDAGLKINVLYARACVRDSLVRGEVPFASHLFYTQPGILDDTIPAERILGINAGKQLIESIPGIVTIVYEDLGISRGMQFGIDRASECERSIEYRILGSDWHEKEVEIAHKHAHARLWDA